MPSWQEWLDRGKRAVSGIVGDYTSANQQSGQLGNELAEAVRMRQIGQQALHPETAMPMMPPRPLSSPAPIDEVNPGYQPIGGDRALEQLYAGKPPALLPPPSAKKLK